MSTVHKHNPPDPNAKCICGSDDNTGFRYSIVCPKHDGEYLREIRVVKPDEPAIISDHRHQLLRKIGNAQAEIGRLNKLLDEIRADVLESL